MQIAIVGTGAIGSTFAYQLARAGHEVTAVARGARLAQLERDRAIVLASGERAAVRVSPTLDPAVAHDLVIVAVLAPQLAAVRPSLEASAARAIMTMFNTFEPLDGLREAVGADRLRVGFPGGVFALLRDGRVAPQIRPGTTVDDGAWADVFTRAGIPTVVDRDMHAWLRTHAALVAPVMATGVLAHDRGAGISWAEARTHAAAMASGFRLVERLGHRLTPSYAAALARLPRAAVAALLWAMSRTQMQRDLGSFGPGEARMLIDMMTAAAPGQTGELLAIRP